MQSPQQDWLPLLKVQVLSWPMVNELFSVTCPAIMDMSVTWTCCWRALLLLWAWLAKTDLRAWLITSSQYIMNIQLVAADVTDSDHREALLCTRIAREPDFVLVMVNELESRTESTEVIWDQIISDCDSHFIFLPSCEMFSINVECTVGILTHPDNQLPLCCST